MAEECDRLREELRLVKHENAWLKVQIRRRRRRKRSNPKAQEIHTLTEENEKLKLTVEMLRMDLKTIERREHKDKEIEELNADKEALKKENTKLDETISKLNMQLKKRSKEYTTMKDRNQLLQQNNKIMGDFLRTKGHELTSFSEIATSTELRDKLSDLQIKDQENRRHVERAMTQEHRDILARQRVHIINDLNPKMVVDILIEKGVLNDHMRDEVMSAGTLSDKCRKLLEILPTRGDSAFKHFHDALEKDYRHLATLLESRRAMYF